MNGRVVQHPQGGKQSRGQGVGVCLPAVGQGGTVGIKRQLLLEAEHPVAGNKMPMNIFRRLFPGTGHNDHRLLGGIVPVFHARRLHHRVLVDLGGNGLVHHQIAQHGNQLLRGDSAGAQEPGPIFRQVHDGGFHPHPAGAAVHDGVNFSVVVMAHMLGGGGGGLAGKVGRGGGNGHSRQGNDFPGDIIVRTPDSHGSQPCRGALGHDVPHRQHHGQRPRPEFFRQGVGRCRNVLAEPLHFLRLRHMENQRIVLGTTLGLEDFQNRLFIQAVGAQTVDRLRGDGHQAAVLDDGGGNFRGFRSLCV